MNRDEKGLEAEIRLRAALEEIVALEPEKKRYSQHEHYIAMLKALGIARKALSEVK